MIQVDIGLPEELYRRLCDIAAEQGRTASDVLVDAAKVFAEKLEDSGRVRPVPPDEEPS